MTYRPEIDGLRAVAVGSVVLFHAGAPGFAGGYVGVDVFFVISGFLITGILLRELREGRFSLARFYERRARRILPALTVVLVASALLAPFALLPRQLAEFGEALLATALFGSNLLYWRRVDYFAPAAEQNPLVHTWSLGVEEQFYLLFPLALMLLARAGLVGRGGNGGRALPWLLAAALAASLALAEWASRRHAAFAFYALPTRAWQLLAGALLASLAGALEPRSRRWDGAVAALGLGLVGGSVAALEARTPMPGVFAVPAVLGAVLVLGWATPATLAGRLLSTRPLVGIGLVSYSAYLWHQPLLAFLRAQSLGPATPLGLGAAVLGTFALAAITWRFVETPFRRPRAGSGPAPAGTGAARSARPARALLGAGAASLALAALGAGLAGGAEAWGRARLTPAQLGVLAFEAPDARRAFRRAYREGECFLLGAPRLADLAPDCLSSEPPERQVLLYGDSHAASLAPALRETLGGRLSVATVSGCAPLLHASELPCARFGEDVRAALRARPPGEVVLAARWDAAAARPDFERRLRAALLDLLGAGVRRVTILGPFPEWTPSNPAVLAAALGRTTPEGEVSLPNPRRAAWAALDRRLAGVAASLGAPARAADATIEHRSVADALCAGDACLAGVAAPSGPVPVAWDYGHLTRDGGRAVLRRLPPPTETGAP